MADELIKINDEYVCKRCGGKDFKAIDSENERWQCENCGAIYTLEKYRF
jgi:rubredoxin